MICNKSNKQEAASIKHLELAERRALRVVMGVGPRTSNKTLYEKAQIQPIAERLEGLRNRAIDRYDPKSTLLQDLAILKQIIGE